MTLRIYTITMICCLAASALLAQQPLEEKAMMLNAAKTQTGIKLHWTPTDVSSFDAGLTGGYSLERLTVSQGGVDTPLADLAATKIMLDANILKLPKGSPSWNPNLGNAADTVIHYFEYEPVVTNSLADAQAYEQTNLDRFQFGMFMSYMDFPTAQQMALAYDDQSTEANTTYMYRLEQLSTGETDVVIIATDSLTSFPAIDQVEATAENGVIALTWPTDDIDQDYFSYNIWQSEDGQNYTKVNEEPYVYFQSGDGDLDDYLFLDSIEVYGETYHYQIEGLTMFGIMGERSEAVEVLAVPFLTNIGPVIEINDITETEVIMDWTIPNEDPNVLSFIAGYNVYRSDKADSEFQLITQSPITGQQFTDTSPLPSGYYIIATVDDFGQEYSSLPQFAQLEDVTPPVVPIGLEARESATAQYELTWDENTEIDLEGYLLYTQYPGSQNYVMISKDIIEETTFIFNYPPDLNSDEICFKISAIDRRGNESDMSGCFTVEIPDEVPPAMPFMSKHKAIEEGIALGWQYSTSADVAQHELQRKRSAAPSWETIKIISVTEQEADTISLIPEDSLMFTNYIDTTLIEQRSYDYRMMAVDSSENKSYSTIVSVTPLAGAAIGLIENFTVSSVMTVEPGAMPQQDAYDVIQDAITLLTDNITPNYNDLQILAVYRIITGEQYNNLPNLSNADAKIFLEEVKDEYWTADMFVTLRWDYENLDQLLYFQVYRSIDGRGFIDFIDILPVSEQTMYQFDDGYIMEGHNYLYKVMAVHAGGRFSEVSESLFVRIP